ncbi:AraC family transcriptional regulator [Paenibacillus sp. IB182496]|uniref:AraC family transcriptional regulator n=1 Tax=Paenibacillus sabuli TaxID=2772509 RepID=A0A927BVP9_9BACL|nr:AraC family transcriptional regulator [Paenibacillus sabuli]MBD2846339.1 AraC family transcriptional regulator [Paenibacillus sabuli]
MKRIPLLLQLVLVLFGIMAVPTAILTWYSGEQMLGNSERAIADSAMAGLNASRRLNETALSHLAQNAVRLASTQVFDQIRRYETFAELNAKYSNMSSALSVLGELLNLNHRVDGVYASYFYLEGADYVISTDKGITTLERYADIGWMDEALEGRRGISGVWHARRLESGIPVVSYLFPLSRLSTTTRGVIVVNLRERQVGSYLQSSERGEQGYMLIDEDGRVVSHRDKGLLLTDGRALPHIQDVLSSSKPQGHAFYTQAGKRLLYTWSHSKLFDWWSVQVYSVDELMTSTYKLQRGIILITALVILVGTVLAVLLAAWLSRPIRSLVRVMRDKAGLGGANRNELVALGSAFGRMREEQEELRERLKEREHDTHRLAVHNLLRGEVTEQALAMFPQRSYAVAVAAIDRYRRYVSKHSPETRSYHRYLVIDACESLLPECLRVRCVYQGEGSFAILLNAASADCKDEAIGEAMRRVRERVLELLGHSVTIGVSAWTDAASGVPRRLDEALEAVKQRMIRGSGCLIRWEEPASGEKYVYPAHRERRIVNYMDAGDLPRLLLELEGLQEEIMAAEGISCDNILFIYNQLLGATIRHLREHNVNTTRMYAGRGNVYSALAAMETLDELHRYTRDFFTETVRYLARERGAGDSGYGDKILRYLQTHYGEEIVYEEMARTIGISYSYMRKIFYELTGKSLIEYTNMLRIEQAKQLLLDTDWTIARIAAEVGYANVQSFNRFFRKFEGMPPSGYKAVKASSS